MNSAPSIFQPRFLHPRFWLTWTGLGVISLIVRLPHPVRIRIGEFIGSLGHFLARRRRHIVETNLRLCFPEDSDQHRRELTRAIFRSTGAGLIETATVWLRGADPVRHLATIHGLAHLEKARDLGKGVLLLGMHFSTLDLAGTILSSFLPFHVMYRGNKNELIETIMVKGRDRNFPDAIRRDDIRGVIRALRAGHIVWYGADQDYGRRHSVFAPFFNMEAASVSATARIARITGAPVIPFTHYRSPDGKRYEICLGPPLEDFPTPDEVHNATVVNGVIEEAIRKSPEQYWWLHRRFKTRPEGQERPY